MGVGKLLLLRVIMVDGIFLCFVECWGSALKF